MCMSLCVCLRPFLASNDTEIELHSWQMRRLYISVDNF